MYFESPYLLLLLLGVILMAAHYIGMQRRGGATLTLSTIEGVKRSPRTFRYYLRHLPAVLRMLAFAALVVALARPQKVESLRNISAEGIDIVLALDISSSMLARDFEPDRITAAKQVAASFVRDRTGDRLGLVAFAGESYTLSPLTTDQNVLQTLLAQLRSGVIEDGTAIGNGLATALNRMRESSAKSKVIILLTDGVNNRGEIAPVTAAEIAREMGVKVYTIGVGTQGKAPYPRFNHFGELVDYVQVEVEIDEEMLSRIAESTGGKYYRATDNKKLEAIYEEINTLEKSEVEIAERTLYHEQFFFWAALGFLLLCIEFVFKYLILKRLP